MPILNSLISSSVISKLISLGFKTEQPSVSIIENTSDAANAAFGASLSVSGQHIVVGSPRLFPLSDTTIPAVQVYDFSGSELFTLYNPSVGNTTYTSFGNSVGVANNYIIVGDSNYIANSTHRPGRAYVYNATNGALLYTLDNPNSYGNANDEFGHAVAISSQYAVVSAIGEDVTGGGIQPEGIDQGIAYVYNTANGALLYTLNNPEASDESYTAEEFGFNVAITNTHVVITSPFEDTGTDFYSLNLGKVFVYSTANGSLLHTISYPSEFGNNDPSYSSDQFGRAVGASPSYLIVGAPVRGEFNIGRAYLYSIADGSLLYTFTNPNATNYNEFTGGPGKDDFFGFSVAVTEQYAIVSAPFTENADYYSLGANNTGRVYVYGTANGSLLHTIINPYVVGAYPGGYSPGQSGFGSFGRGVAITPSGSSIVASRFTTSGSGAVRGSAHTYSK